MKNIPFLIIKWIVTWIVTWLLRGLLRDCYVDCYVQGQTISGAYSASGTGDMTDVIWHPSPWPEALQRKPSAPEVGKWSMSRVCASAYNNHIVYVNAFACRGLESICNHWTFVYSTVRSNLHTWATCPRLPHQPMCLIAACPTSSLPLQSLMPFFRETEVPV